MVFFLGDMQTKLVDNREFILGREKLRVIEAKRPTKPKYIEGITGIVGSFKKLDLD